MTIKIPNEVGTTLAGTPSPASIATESRDGTQSVGQSDNIQQISLVNIMAELRNFFAVLARRMSLLSDPSTGRIRLQIEDIFNDTGGNIWAAPLPIYVSSFTGIPYTHQSTLQTVYEVWKTDTWIPDHNRDAWQGFSSNTIKRS